MGLSGDAEDEASSTSSDRDDDVTDDYLKQLKATKGLQRTGRRRLLRAFEPFHKMGPMMQAADVPAGITYPELSAVGHDALKQYVQQARLFSESGSTSISNCTKVICTACS